MKRNIVICCDQMLHGIAVGFVTPRLDGGLMAVRAEKTYPVIWEFCPWCSKKLPFPYKEAK